MKKLIALMLVFFFLFGCASATIIKSKPSGADVYFGEKLLGKTPQPFSSGGIGGTKYDFTLKKEGYQDNPVQISRNRADIGRIVGSIFVFFPLLLWWGNFEDTYEFPMEKLEATSTSAPVAPSSGAVKIVTVTWTVVNIREGYSDAYPVVATVVQGDKLTVIGEYREWFNVRLEGGKQGWVNSRVVK